ncbi:MAG: UDP-N-acetylmuramoyl-L-alanyl-D-glutamate--2,6-diaminopimelate ligase [Firmicutes bacterium]|nr:UDP-N-acetylmuramoyl-L-alanyl-D-glutamate--2,6-diaminopimelate ligase [Bacillota bacterium]
MRLSKLFKDAPTTNVTGLCVDSRKVEKGNIYFCMPGMSADGHDFINQAIDKGAICIVHAKDIENKRDGAIYIKVDDVVSALNTCAKIFNNNPSGNMVMYGVTGTNGKSSITKIIKYFCDTQTPCGYIGTISIEYGKIHLQPNLTTPGTLFLMDKLRDMVEHGIGACALEVSSHGLAQRRVDAIDFDVAVFTNFTHDHLDFHGTIENYFSAKKLLFSERVREDGVSILNIDDARFEDLKEASKARVISYGVKKECDYRAKDIVLKSDSTTFTLVFKGKEYPVETNLVAEYNIYNLLAAIASMHETGMSIETLTALARNIPQIEGRMEQIRCGQPFDVIVDFAHTPDGMEKVMQFGREIAQNNRLISVFGSAGRRDIQKRKVFGEIADKYCDLIIVTEDDPRDESPKEIGEQIKSGITKTTTVFIEDRYEAIRQAIESCQAGDCVLVLGKGDESYIYRGDNVRVPWVGDNNAVKECIEKYWNK